MELPYVRVLLLVVVEVCVRVRAARLPAVKGTGTEAPAVAGVVCSKKFSLIIVASFMQCVRPCCLHTHTHTHTIDYFGGIGEGRQWLVIKRYPAWLFSVGKRDAEKQHVLAVSLLPNH